MLEGQVKHVSADATDAGANPNSSANDPRSQTTPNQSGGGYKALVALKSTELDAQGRRFALAAGMRVTAEIHLGTRSVLEYLLSPVTKTVMEAGRER